MPTRTRPVVGLTISTDPRRLDLRVVHRFLTKAYWSPGIPLRLVRKSIKGSFPFGIYDGRRQVGFARVISDYVTYGYLADVFVIEAYCGRELPTR